MQMSYEERIRETLLGLTKLLIITAYLTQRCDVIFALSEEKEEVKWGRTLGRIQKGMGLKCF